MSSVWLRWILPWGAWIPWGNAWLPLLEVIHTSGHRVSMWLSVCWDSHRTWSILFGCSHPSPGDVRFLLVRVNRQSFAAGQAEMCAGSSDDSKTQPWHWGCHFCLVSGSWRAWVLLVLSKEKRAALRTHSSVECRVVLGQWCSQPAMGGRQGDQEVLPGWLWRVSGILWCSCFWNTLSQQGFSKYTPIHLRTKRGPALSTSLTGLSFHFPPQIIQFSYAFRELYLSSDDFSHFLV